MAISKAKKQRQKREREGYRNPELSRSPFALVDLRSKVTKTKNEQLNKNKHKNQNHFYKDDGSFCLAIINIKYLHLTVHRFDNKLPFFDLL